MTVSASSETIMVTPPGAYRLLLSTDQDVKLYNFTGAPKGYYTIKAGSSLDLGISQYDNVYTRETGGGLYLEAVSSNATVNFLYTTVL